MKTGPKPKPIADRLWQRVDRSDRVTDAKEGLDRTADLVRRLLKVPKSEVSSQRSKPQAKEKKRP